MMPWAASIAVFYLCLDCSASLSVSYKELFMFLAFTLTRDESFRGQNIAISEELGTVVDGGRRLPVNKTSFPLPLLVLRYS